jgi:hypothetical protein
MKLSPTQIYKDIFHREPPRSWLEGTPEERQRAINDFMRQADEAEVSDADFDLFLHTIHENRRAKAQLEQDTVSAA